MLRNVVTALVFVICVPCAFAGLFITEVMPQTTSGTPSAINGDWWELTNAGNLPVNLGGYQWADTEDQLPSSDSNFFPAFVIAPGQSIIILEEAAASEAQWRTNWGIGDSVAILAMDEMVDDATPDGDTFSGLSASGDAVFFYDPAGTLLSSYSFGTVTRGTSFEADTLGTDLGLSVVGENGAVAAANGDIGSPGFAVPEPASLALVAVLGLLARRR
jgi:hypothetical protein